MWTVVVFSSLFTPAILLFAALSGAVRKAPYPGLLRLILLALAGITTDVGVLAILDLTGESPDALNYASDILVSGTFLLLGSYFLKAGPRITDRYLGNDPHVQREVATFTFRSLGCFVALMGLVVVPLYLIITA